ncbi:MAG: 16S rRNA processing protein RimM [Lachnospiraceae bacterium]|nr:16S rRNA processing protein RimM [Lachnospiraceae bacterium]
MKQEYFRVGVIVKPHGVRGEAKVYPTSEDPERYRDLKKVLITNGTGEFRTEVLSSRHQPPYVIIRFEGIDTPEQVDRLRNYDVMVSRDDAIPLEEGQHYVADLIGMKVVTDEGEDLGTLKDILETGANDVYDVVSESGEEILIPGIDQCILAIDEETELITVHLLKGLRD